MTSQKMKNICFKGGVLAMGVLAGSMGLLSHPASALVDTPWGPDRKTFTWEDPAPYAVFNSITNNPSIGDERNFVRVRDIENNVYVDDITLEAGKTYEIYIYYHNNADAHEVGKQAIGIADGVTMTSNFPATIKAGEKLTANAKITAKDTDPLAVWDGVYLRANEDLTLKYVPNTALIFNGGALNGQSIGPQYLFGEGSLLGYNKFSGMLPGCNEYAGRVVYQIKADRGSTPVPPPGPEPTPTPDPEPVPEPTPETPSELPNTGPAEIVVATVIVLAILAGGFYWLTMRKHFQKTVRVAAASKKPGQNTAARQRAARSTVRIPVKRTAVKRATRKRAVRKVVRKRK